MINFYRILKNDGKDMASALQEAQIKIMEENSDNSRSHPYYRAPFILIGDWE